MEAQKTEEEMVADAISMAKARFAAAEAEKAEQAKWDVKRTVGVAAIPRQSSDPNSKKFDHYWVHGRKLEHGAPHEQMELTERQIHDLKLDVFVSVDDPTDEAQQAAKSKAAAEAKAKAIADAQALLSQEGITPRVAMPAGVAPAAQEALAELQTQKKGKRY